MIIDLNKNLSTYPTTQLSLTVQLGCEWQIFIFNNSKTSKWTKFRYWIEILRKKKENQKQKHIEITGMGLKIK